MFLLSLFYPLNPYSCPLRKPLSPEGIVRRANPSDIQISLVWNGSSESPFLMSTLTRVFISNKQVFLGPHFEKLVRAEDLAPEEVPGGVGEKIRIIGECPFFQKTVSWVI